MDLIVCRLSSGGPITARSALVALCLNPGFVLSSVSRMPGLVRGVEPSSVVLPRCGVLDGGVLRVILVRLLGGAMRLLVGGAIARLVPIGRIGECASV